MPVQTGYHQLTVLDPFRDLSPPIHTMMTAQLVLIKPYIMAPFFQAGSDIVTDIALTGNTLRFIMNKSKL